MACQGAMPPCIIETQADLRTFALEWWPLNLSALL
jgi:hypothetical protein